MALSEQGPPGSAQLTELLRYGAVVVVGLAVDIGVSLGLRLWLGLPLEVTSVAGFSAGLVVNYVLFELWVFGTRRISIKRLGQTYLSSLFALGVRVAAIWVLNALWVSGKPEIDLAKLLAATALSFVVNFVVVRKLLRQDF